MAHKPEKRTQARAAYVYEAMTLEMIAERICASIGTISRWKRDAEANGDDWDRARSAARLSGAGAEAVTAAVMEDFILLFQSTLIEVKTATDIGALQKAEVISRLSDAYNKTMSAVARGNPKLSKLSVAMEVMGLMLTFIRRAYPQHAAVVLEFMEPFGAELARQYG